MKVIVCKPTHFRIDYSINGWMEPGTKINKPALLDEYEGLKNAYKSLGLEIIEFEQEQSLPDMVYTKDWGIVDGDKFIPGRFKHRQRSKESKIAIKYFKELGYQISTWKTRDYFEGGDVIKRSGKYYMGWGKRSSKRSAEHLEKITGCEVVDFKTTNNHFYHLDTCIMPLNESSVLYYPDALTMIEQAKISYHFSNPIAIQKEDAAIMACNCVVIEDKIIINELISKKLETKLRGAGFELIKVKIHEYLKGGGSICCLSLLFDGAF